MSKNVNAQNEYGSLIRNARLSMRKTQQQLADEAGVSRNTVANIENGDTNPQPQVKAKIESALKLDTPTSHDITSIVASIYLLLDTLPSRKQEQVVTEIAELIGKHIRENQAPEPDTNKTPEPTKPDYTLVADPIPNNWHPDHDHIEPA